MVKVTVYVEGGGDTELLKSDCRKAFRKFVESAEIMGVKFISGGGRNQTHDSFCTALKKPRSDEVVLLLLDAEGPLKPGTPLWTHLASRLGNGLAKPDGADEEHLFLMVECMETWFLACPSVLEDVFKNDFNPGALSKWPNLEQVPKQTIYDALEKATSGRYKDKSKGRYSFEILARLDAGEVAQRCPNAARFLDRLRKHRS